MIALPAVTAQDNTRPGFRAQGIGIGLLPVYEIPGQPYVDVLARGHRHGDHCDQADHQQRRDQCDAALAPSGERLRSTLLDSFHRGNWNSQTRVPKRVCSSVISMASGKPGATVTAF